MFIDSAEEHLCVLECVHVCLMRVYVCACVDEVELCWMYAVQGGLTPLGRIYPRT